MTDPLTSLALEFPPALAAVLGDAYADRDPVLRRSDRADYQANVAMALAKEVGRPPRALAEALVAKLDLARACEKIEIAGPGFLNLHLRADWIAEQLEETARDERLGVAPKGARETVVIDYSAPNVAKEMHVGHLPSTLIGDTLARVLEHLGHRVVRQNHIGDWGTPFGMLLEHMREVVPDLLEGAEMRGEERTLERAAALIGDLGAFYKAAREKFDGDAAFADRARKRVVLLQSGDAATLELWRELVAVSTRYFADVYAKLGVTLTPEDVRGESAYNDELEAIIKDLEERGVARVSDGALCVFPAGFTGKTGDPLPLIVRKQDGGFGYATTDLAALRHRIHALGASRILYVVGAPQSQHFEMVFAVARAAGWLTERTRVEHVAFGSILGPDRKILRSRSGDAIRLVELVDDAVERARKVIAAKNTDIDEGSRERLARQIGIGAVKYATLSGERIKDHVFDWDRMLSFDGNTAPYLQYAHARIRSMLRKADAAPGAFIVGTPEERALALALLSLPGVVASVADSLQPHKLAGYLFDLATAFTSFYERCPVLKAETPELRASRLALSELTARVLERGLSLLGIEAPDRM